MSASRFGTNRLFLAPRDSRDSRFEQPCRQCPDRQGVDWWSESRPRATNRRGHWCCPRAGLGGSQSMRIRVWQKSNPRAGRLPAREIHGARRGDRTRSTPIRVGTHESPRGTDSPRVETSTPSRRPGRFAGRVAGTGFAPTSQRIGAQPSESPRGSNSLSRRILVPAREIHGGGSRGRLRCRVLGGGRK